MKYKTVEELLSDPKRWTQKANARDSDGAEVRFDSDDAVCWCLWGAMAKVIPMHDRTRVHADINNLIEEGAVQFNDTHTHAEVLALVKEAGI